MVLDDSENFLTLKIKHRKIFGNGTRKTVLLHYTDTRYTHILNIEKQNRTRSDRSL